MKGLLFSFILVILGLTLATILYFYQTLTIFSFKKYVELESVEKLIKTYNSILIDSKKALGIVGKRAISSAISWIITNGTPLDSAEIRIKELMINGTLYGKSQELMKDSTLLNWAASLENLLNKKGLFAKIEIKNLSIIPYDSFHLLLSANISLNLTNQDIRTSIARSQIVSSIISIENFEDPLYPLNTLGRVTNVIIKSKNWLNYSSEDLTNLKEDLNNSWYHPSLYGASFLDRLEGKFFVDPKRKGVKEIIGLESFVNKEKLYSYGLGIWIDRSNIDYLYFSGTPHTAFKITGMPETFRLDNETTINNLTHLQIYNVSSLVE